MTGDLFVQAIAKVLAGVILMGVLLFLPAGTLAYPEGWRFMILLFVPMILAGFVMMKKSPALLAKRLNMKERLGEQKQVIVLSGLMFLAGFAVSGLSFRYGFLLLPGWVSFAACAVFLLSYLMYALVLRENAFLSRTIEVQENQYVVDTGLYAFVRHPMYSATVLLFLSMPLILRSIAGFAVFLAYPLIIAKRIRGEEAFLRENLAGYAQYCEKVRFRLIPFIW